ncbi:uncharacterized protein FIBRA_01932 [Fibroporia radiculosa]|uniref:Uncharacterized protein n=1 Tax=Fibroporia radiculosa TaxID=599839 RepID=J4HU46_9APHY|nr:uncharacterized protein FIBRA_01932 [Fibroporia radiculosa]CCL99907.1 predicted protein [Fibroporia radiculosa]
MQVKQPPVPPSSLPIILLSPPPLYLDTMAWRALEDIPYSKGNLKDTRALDRTGLRLVKQSRPTLLTEKEIACITASLEHRLQDEGKHYSCFYIFCEGEPPDDLDRSFNGDIWINTSLHSQSIHFCASNDRWTKWRHDDDDFDMEHPFFAIAIFGWQFAG